MGILKVLVIVLFIQCGAQAFEFGAKAYVVELFSKIIKLAPEPAKSLLSAVTITMMGDFEEKDQNYLTRSDSERRSRIENKIRRILIEMESLKLSVNQLQNELKIQTITEYQTEMKAEYGSFEQIVLGYGNNERKLKEEIDEFIKSYKLKNFENKISYYLNEAAPTSFCQECEAFVDPSLQWSFRKLSPLGRTLIEFTLRNKNLTRSPIKSSPNKMIYDFHVAMLLKIYEGNAFLLACYELQRKLSGSATPDEYYEINKRYVATRNSDALDKIVSSMKTTLLFVNQHQDLISFNNLHTSPVKIEFKNVLQLFVEFLYYLSFFNQHAAFRDIGKHHLTCDDADNSLFNKGDGCFGSVKNCKYTGESCEGQDLHRQYFTTNSEYGVLSDNPDRIYSLIGSKISVLEAKAKECNHNDGENKLSDVCVCICDQFNHPRTERWLYGGAVKAPNGYVVTGVRFRKHLRVIYLQIQVGKLMPGAFINASSVVWQEPPTDIEKNILIFNFGSRQLLLDDLFFDDAVLTGVQFYPNFNMYAMRIFGRKIINLALNQLDDVEVSKVVSEKFKFEEKSLDEKIPGLEPLKQNWCDDFANQLGQARSAQQAPLGCSTLNLSYKTISLQNFTLTYGRIMNASLLGLTATENGAVRVNNILNRDMFSNTVIKFGMSNQEADIGQTFVPFFDGVDVTFDFVSPLSGLGLLHYTNDDKYAGYIRPYLRSFNYNHYLIFYEKFLKYSQESVTLRESDERRKISWTNDEVNFSSSSDEITAIPAGSGEAASYRINYVLVFILLFMTCMKCP